jgi:uncharacterized protein YdeI (BOF family)
MKAFQRIKRTLLFFLLFAILVLSRRVPSVASAQSPAPTPETPPKQTDIPWINQNGIDGMSVSVRGNVAALMGDDSLILSDGGGAILVRIGSESLSKLSAEPGQSLQIVGVVRLSMDKKAELEAQSVARIVEAKKKDGAEFLESPVLPVSEILEKARKGDEVAAEGRIVRAKDVDRFVLRDEGGEILVIADFTSFYKMDLTVAQRIRVIGKFRNPWFGKPRIIASRVKVITDIKRSTGLVGKEEEANGAAAPTVTLDAPTSGAEVLDISSAPDSADLSPLTETDFVDGIPTRHGPPRLISWVNSGAKNKELVTVRGQITGILGKGKQRGQGRYLLKDNSGELVLYASPEIFVKLGLKVSDRITVTGEMDRSWVYTDKLIGLHITVER